MHAKDRRSILTEDPVCHFEVARMDPVTGLDDWNLFWVNGSLSNQSVGYVFIDLTLKCYNILEILKNGRRQVEAARPEGRDKPRNDRSQ